MLELQPMAGEEMNLPQADSHHDGFIAGERTMAAQILDLLEEKDDIEVEETPEEQEMVLGR
ncbi:MAG: hypothetical protein LV479_10340 [Methylacidiphilales bacterium]|nr:hypothetical protein [Candidatus Methylacidiphilales bacterium]